MRHRRVFGWVLGVVLGLSAGMRVPAGSAADAGAPGVRFIPRIAERLDRGVVALRRPDGAVYVGWRLLSDDPAATDFDVVRRARGGDEVRLATVRDSTNFVDRDVPVGGGAFAYRVITRRPGSAPAVSAPVTVDLAQPAQPYLSVTLDPRVKGFMHPMVADLTGDGRLDIVVKTPDSYLMPDEASWHRDSRTYTLHAVTLDGETLWSNDLGPAIEMGNWYSPHVAFDLDGDGKAEVAIKTGEAINDPTFRPVRDADGRVIDDREYLSVWEGGTGEPVTRVPWPSREGFKNYNTFSRNLLGIAYLDGKTPSLIAVRGTYGLIRMSAYRYRNRALERVWEWVSTQEKEAGYHGDGTRNGSGSHFMHAADVDVDGRDEVIYGSFVIDDDGTGLWAMRRVGQGRTTPGGHPDGHFVGDILPGRPGLEIFYAYEKWHERNGACLVDAATGELIWGTDAKTGHFHKAGLCADIDASRPGMECYGRDDELSSKDAAHAWLWAADGTVLGEGNAQDWGSQPQVAYWDADPQRELILNDTIRNYPDDGDALSMAGCSRTILVADILGDWREEIIRSTPGNELRIYTTTIATDSRLPTLLHDPIYRIDVANNGMGYPQAPMVSRCLQRP